MVHLSHPGVYASQCGIPMVYMPPSVVYPGVYLSLVGIPGVYLSLVGIPGVRASLCAIPRCESLPVCYTQVCTSWCWLFPGVYLSVLVIPGLGERGGYGPRRVGGERGATMRRVVPLSSCRIININVRKVGSLGLWVG